MNVSASLVKMEAPALMSSIRLAAGVLLESEVFQMLLSTNMFALHCSHLNDVMMSGRLLQSGLQCAWI